LFSELLRPSGRRLVGGLLVGLGAGLLFGLDAGLLFGLGVGLEDGRGAGLFVGLGVGLGTWFSVILVSGLGIGLGSGLVGGLVLGDIAWLVLQPGSRLLFVPEDTLRDPLRNAASLGFEPGFKLLLGLGAGLVDGMLVGLVYKLWGGFVAGLSRGEIATKTTPNEGIHRSARIALISELVVGLGFGLVVGLGLGLRGGLVLGLSIGPLVGLLVGLSTGLRYWGRACLQHELLRLGLRYHGLVPWHYVNFLDYAADRIFLHKVGGGYLFIHRQLQDYFAARHRDPGRGSASS
jgi:hypothetical protein